MSIKLLHHSKIDLNRADVGITASTVQHKRLMVSNRPPTLSAHDVITIPAGEMVVLLAHGPPNRANYGDDKYDTSGVGVQLDLACAREGAFTKYTTSVKHDTGRVSQFHTECESDFLHTTHGQECSLSAVVEDSELLWSASFALMGGQLVSPNCRESSNSNIPPDQRGASNTAVDCFPRYDTYMKTMVYQVVQLNEGEADATNATKSTDNSTGTPTTVGDENDAGGTSSGTKGSDTERSGAESSGAESSGAHSTPPRMVYVPPSSPSVKGRVHAYEELSPGNARGMNKKTTGGRNGLGEEVGGNSNGAEGTVRKEQVCVEAIASQMLQELRAARKTVMWSNCLSGKLPGAAGGAAVASTANTEASTAHTEATMAAMSTVQDAVTGEDCVCWLTARHPQLCMQFCPGAHAIEQRRESGELSLQQAGALTALMMEKGAIRLGNVLRQKGYMRKVQTAVTLPVHAGWLRRYPEQIDWQNIANLRGGASAVSASHFRKTSSLFCIVLRAAKVHVQEHRPTGITPKTSRERVMNLFVTGREAMSSLAQIDLGAFADRVPDKREMRHRTICRLSELDVDWDDVEGDTEGSAE
jgi:hypothetical protein